MREGFEVDCCSLRRSKVAAWSATTSIAKPNRGMATSLLMPRHEKDTARFRQHLSREKVRIVEEYQRLLSTAGLVCGVRPICLAMQNANVILLYNSPDLQHLAAS